MPTNHKLACLHFDLHPVGVTQSSLQLYLINSTRSICVHRLEPLVQVRIDGYKQIL